MKQGYGAEVEERQRQYNAVIDGLIGVINSAEESEDIEPALIEVLSLFILQNSEKPYEAIGDVSQQLRDTFYEQLHDGLSEGSLMVAPTGRLTSLSGPLTKED